jgi:molybdenum cofactor cytidylyltransferase
MKSHRLYTHRYIACRNELHEEWRPARKASGWVIALADVPRIPVAVIQAVAAGLDQGADLIAPDYQGQRGHPVGFAARHGPALMRLHGDTGARGVIAANSGSLELIESRDAGVIFDIDSLASLRNL